MPAPVAARALRPSIASRPSGGTAGGSPPGARGGRSPGPGSAGSPGGGSRGGGERPPALAASSVEQRPPPSAATGSSTRSGGDRRGRGQGRRVCTWQRMETAIEQELERPLERGQARAWGTGWSGPRLQPAYHRPGAFGCEPQRRRQFGGAAARSAHHPVGAAQGKAIQRLQHAGGRQAVRVPRTCTRLRLAFCTRSRTSGTPHRRANGISTRALNWPG